MDFAKTIIPPEYMASESIAHSAFGLMSYRELKIETFSRRRRPDWQSKPGTEVAVASLQNSNIKIAVNSGGRRLGRLPKRKIWLHIKN